MRIALVSPYDFGVPGGVNSHVSHLARALRDRGCDPWIFAPGDAGIDLDQRVMTIGRSIPVPSGGSLARVTLSPRSGRWVRERLAEGNFDIIHAHEPLVPVLPIQFLRIADVPKVGTFHTARERGSRLYTLNQQFLKRWSRMIDARVAVSKAAARLVSRYFPGDYDIIPNGIDVDRFALPAPRPPTIPAGRPYILFVGRFEERKGLLVLLRAFQQVQKNHPGLRLVVVGDGNRRPRYERWVERMGIDDVQFEGYVPNESLAAYYQHAAVFCAPNTGNESFGVVLLEAMAAGCPVVASAIAGFSDVVTDGVDGLLAEPNDPRALAEAIDRVLSDRRLADSLVANGHSRAQEYSWERVVDRVLDLYASLLGNGVVPGGGGRNGNGAESELRLA